MFISSKSDEARSEELELDLADENLGVGSLIPAVNTDDTMLLGDRIEDAKRVDLSGSPADAVVGKLKVNRVLKLRHCRGVVEIGSSTRVILSFIFLETPFKTRRMYVVTLWPPDMLRARARTTKPCQAAAAAV